MASQRESEKLRAAALKLRAENAALGEKLSGLESVKEDLEERALGAERGLTAVKALNGDLQRQLSHAMQGSTDHAQSLGSGAGSSNFGGSLGGGFGGGFGSIALPPSPAAAYRAAGRDASARYRYSP